MNYKSFRIANKGYTIFKMSPKTASRVVYSLEGFNVNELSDIPNGVELMSKAVSFAVVGSGFLGRFRAFMIYQRIMRKSSFDDLFCALNSVLEIIPTKEVVLISSTLNQFSELIAKENE